jgi:hypothetical protein
MYRFKLANVPPDHKPKSCAVQYAEDFEGLMTAVKLLTLLITMVVLSHVLCCVWYGVGAIDDCGQPSAAAYQYSLEIEYCCAYLPIINLCLLLWSSDCNMLARLGGKKLSRQRWSKSRLPRATPLLTS